ncbi:MAG TPA: type II toxin-antitoxin system RelE/ParE family toxin [Tepidisphaeraceae bacterium]|jgi:mRNA interferase RelE/StbE
MSFTVLYRTSVKRELRRLDARTVRRVDASILALADTPRPPGCVKLSGQLNLWRIRVGDYRIIYELHERELTIVIVSVAHRREVYRGL